MKSSSELFPVALLSAEYKQGVYEDVYSLKPNNSTDHTVEIALVRLHRQGVVRSRPVLLVHDAFCNHWQWLDYGLGGEAGQLVREGFDVWLVDWRGHGLSSRNQRPHVNTLGTMAKYDLPAVLAFIEETTGTQAAVVARGLGCELVSQALADGAPLPELVFLYPARLPPMRRNWVPGVKLVQRVRWLRRRWLRGAGEEAEPRALFVELLSKEGWFGRWVTQSGQPVKSALEQHRHRIRWVFEPGRVPAWLKRLTVARGAVLESPLDQCDWSALLPESYRGTRRTTGREDINRDAARL